MINSCSHELVHYIFTHTSMISTAKIHLKLCYNYSQTFTCTKTPYVTKYSLTGRPHSLPLHMIQMLSHLASMPTCH